MPRRQALFIAGLLVVLPLALWANDTRLTADCDPTDGLTLVAQADARDSGYLLPDAKEQSPYFRHAVYDLVQGRIHFFEQRAADDRLFRYTLADTHDPDCIERRRFDVELSGLPMPAGRCVAAAIVATAESRFTVEGYAGDREVPVRVSVRDRQTGAKLVEYRRSRFARFTGAGECLREAAGDPGHPVWNLTSFVFPDQRGDVFSLADLDWIRQQHAEGADAPRLLPPPGWVERRLAEDGVRTQPACALPGWLGETEVHAIELERGPLEVEARLDSAGSKAGMAILDVHAPGKAVIILARAQGPTVWHVHESGQSSVVAVLLRSDHGQAVLGLSPFTRILMSTRLHNPHTNCTALELRDIEHRVTHRYGITRSQRQTPGEPASVRYGIGEPMPEGGELFYYDRVLSDFELRGE